MASGKPYEATRSYISDLDGLECYETEGFTTQAEAYQWLYNREAEHSGEIWLEGRCVFSSGHAV